MAGLYLMDEPEAALSFSSCLRLVALMRELGLRRGQSALMRPTGHETPVLWSGQ
jgi:predicted ATPase